MWLERGAGSAFEPLAVVSNRPPTLRFAGTIAACLRPNSYTRWMRPKALVDSIAALDERLKVRYLNPPYTVGSAMIWPVRSRDRPTTNQARETRSAIADRMDLTLECIRRHFEGRADSPLADVLAAYGDFFALFEGFDEFVDFFHFQDLVASGYEGIRFYLPLEEFERPGTRRTVDEYVAHMEATLSFIDPASTPHDRVGCPFRRLASDTRASSDRAARAPARTSERPCVYPAPFCCQGVLRRVSPRVVFRDVGAGRSVGLAGPGSG